VRHNLATEGISQGVLNETVRHNYQTETLGFQTLAETTRHNIVGEEIGYMNARSQATMASASMIQAAAATSQAASAKLTAQANALLTASKTVQQNEQNYITAKTIPATVVGAYTGVYGNMVDVGNRTISSVSSAFKTLFK
jgi:hypothetical protein